MNASSFFLRALALPALRFALPFGVLAAAPAAAQVELAYVYPSPGAYAFNLVDMSADGRVLVGYEIGPDGWWRSVRWEGGVLTVLPGLRDGAQSHFNLAHAVSADGRVVFGYWGTAWGTPGQNEQLYRWTADTLLASEAYWLAEMYPGSASADGSTAVGYGRPPTQTGISQPLRWVAASGPAFELIGGGFAGRAHGASADGARVAWHDNGPQLARRWEGGASTALGFMGYGQEQNAYTYYFHNPISDDGRTVYGHDRTGQVLERPDGGAEVYVVGLERWRDGDVTMLPFPAGYPTLALHTCYPTTASGDGRVVAGVCHGRDDDGNRTEHPAVVWREGQPPRFLPDDLQHTFGLDLTGWDFDCNDDVYPECSVRALSFDGSAMTGLAVNDGILVVFRVGPPAHPLTVTDTGDDPDADPADGICDADPAEPGEQCTLRAAIETANAEGEAGRIVFDVGAAALGGVATIALEGALPPLTVPVEIDAGAPPPARRPAEAAALAPGPLAGPLPPDHPVPVGMRRLP